MNIQNVTADGESDEVLEKQQDDKTVEMCSQPHQTKDPSYSTKVEPANNEPVTYLQQNNKIDCCKADEAGKLDTLHVAETDSDEPVPEDAVQSAAAAAGQELTYKSRESTRLVAEDSSGDDVIGKLSYRLFSRASVR